MSFSIRKLSFSGNSPVHIPSLANRAEELDEDDFLTWKDEIKLACNNMTAGILDYKGEVAQLMSLKSEMRARPRIQ